MIIEQNTINALKRVLQTTGSSEAITRVFHDTSQARLTQLLEANEIGNQEAIKSLTHSLKGSCAMLGATSCVDICERIEQMVFESNSVLLMTSIIELKHEIELFEINLQQELIC